MLSHEVEEMLIDRLVERVENANTYILEQIGKNIKQILSLKPSDAYRLQQMLKYGGDFNKILKKLADITGMNVKEIYSIFETTAKEDQLFAEQFYEYRKMQFIPYAENIELQRQVRALGTITAMQYINISNTTTIGYVFTDLNGKKTFKNIQQTYYDLIDEAILNVTQGKANLNSAMRRTLKQLGGSGLVV
jgi:DNA-directed RNA polymerase subunit F